MKALIMVAIALFLAGCGTRLDYECRVGVQFGEAYEPPRIVRN